MVVLYNREGESKKASFHVCWLCGSASTLGSTWASQQESWKEFQVLPQSQLSCGIEGIGSHAAFGSWHSESSDLKYCPYQTPCSYQLCPFPFHEVLTVDPAHVLIYLKLIMILQVSPIAVPFYRWRNKEMEPLKERTAQDHRAQCRSEI